jgi:hypothetical protein
MLSLPEGDPTFILSQSTALFRTSFKVSFPIEAARTSLPPRQLKKLQQPQMNMFLSAGNNFLFI